MNDEKTMGKLTILIGPNSFGKTRILEDIFKSDEKKYVYIPTELKWMDEIKDTTTKPITMNVILNDIILPDDMVATSKEEFEKNVRKIVDIYLDDFKKITEKISKFNGIKFKKDNVLQQSKEMLYSHLIALDNNIVKNISSGLGMCFILELLKLSRRTEILLDEPEKFCHPSLLPQIATYINDLLSLGKNVTIATHSPNLVKKLLWNFDNLEIVNEFHKDDKGNIIGNIRKRINLDEVISEKNIQEISKNLISNGSGKAGQKLIGEYIANKDKLLKYLQYRKDNIIDLLFSKNLYLVEGENDLIFLRNYLKQTSQSELIEDYEILKLDGKFIFPIFIAIFNQVKNPEYMKVSSMFDVDNENMLHHKKTNDYIRKYSSEHLEFQECLETAINFTSNKYDSVEFINFLETESINIEDFNFISYKDSSSSEDLKERSEIEEQNFDQ